MKKIFSTLLILLLLFALPTIVGAEKNKWKSNDFNFSVVHNILIKAVKTNPPHIHGYIAAPFSQKKVEMALRQAFEKRQIKIFTSAEGSNENIALHKNSLTIQPIIHALGKWSEKKEAYYETRTVYKKIIVENKYGKTTIITVPTDETIYHPARTAWHAVANLEFIVSSNKGEKVYMLVDDRERAEETDTSGMLGRICNDLADDLTHN